MKLKLFSKDNMSSLSTPQVFKFKTNATKITINFEVNKKNQGYFPHVGIAAQEGIMILYKKENDESWLNVEAMTTRQNNTIYMYHMVDGIEEYEMLIYGPLLSRITQMEIEVPEDKIAYIPDEEVSQEIFVVGGIHSFGIGCTTQSFTLSAILGRKLESCVNTLTFNNKNYLDKVYDFYNQNDFNKHYDIGILEVDYVNQDDSVTQKYLKLVIEEMKKHCDTILCWYCIPPYKSQKKKQIKDLLKNMKDVKVEDCCFLYDIEYSDICTYSGNFINDSGNMMLFKHLEETIIDELIFKKLIGGE